MIKVILFEMNQKQPTVAEEVVEKDTKTGCLEQKQIKKNDQTV
jgi:hypothetical protein